MTVNSDKPLSAGTYNVRDLKRLERCSRHKKKHAPVPQLPLRSNCRTEARPCRRVSCRYHLLTDVTQCGSLKMNRDESDLAQMVDTCALDVSERGGHSLEEVGAIFGITRERVRQVEEDAIAKLSGELQGAGVDAQMVLEHLMQTESGEASPAPERVAKTATHRQSAHSQIQSCDEAANETLTALGLMGKEALWVKRLVRDMAQQAEKA